MRIVSMPADDSESANVRPRNLFVSDACLVSDATEQWRNERWSCFRYEYCDFAFERCGFEERFDRS